MKKLFWGLLAVGYFLPIFSMENEGKENRPASANTARVVESLFRYIRLLDAPKIKKLCSNMGHNEAKIILAQRNRQGQTPLLATVGIRGFLNKEQQAAQKEIAETLVVYGSPAHAEDLSGLTAVGYANHPAVAMRADLKAFINERCPSPISPVRANSKKYRGEYIHPNVEDSFNVFAFYEGYVENEFGFDD